MFSSSYAHSPSSSYSVGRLKALQSIASNAVHSVSSMLPALSMFPLAGRTLTLPLPASCAPLVTVRFISCASSQT